MIKTDKVVIVEGKYDKIKLENILDAVIIETDGFSVFKDREKLNLIRRLASSRGIIIMTDSDSAGFKIRSFLCGSMSNENITHVYIPDVFGKEKRKNNPSKEGKIGVEGMTKEIIEKAFLNAGIPSENTIEPEKRITREDFYEDGLIGKKDSKSKRLILLKKLDLPERLSTSSLLQVINILIDYDEYKRLI